MKRVEVEPGVCGFKAVVEAQAQADGRVALTVHSDCALVREFAATNQVVDPVAALHCRDGSRLLTHPCHTTCLVPLAVLKAVEAEAGLALPRDGAIRFVAT